MVGVGVSKGVLIRRLAAEVCFEIRSWSFSRSDFPLKFLFAMTVNARDPER